MISVSASPAANRISHSSKACFVTFSGLSAAFREPPIVLGWICLRQLPLSAKYYSPFNLFYRIVQGKIVALNEVDVLLLQ